MLPALTSSHKTLLLQHIPPQEERPRPNISWIIFSSQHAGPEIGTFPTAAGHIPVFPLLQLWGEKVSQQKGKNRAITTESDSQTESEH